MGLLDELFADEKNIKMRICYFLLNAMLIGLLALIIFRDSVVNNTINRTPKMLPISSLITFNSLSLLAWIGLFYTIKIVEKYIHFEWKEVKKNG